jgi:hypothetical protein
MLTGIQALANLVGSSDICGGSEREVKSGSRQEQEVADDDAQ